MKIMTLNTHSLIEDNYDKKLLLFIEYIKSEKPDIIAMQEVNQSVGAKEVRKEFSGKYYAADKISVKSDNHAYNAVKNVPEYFWTYFPIKNGYKVFDEGLAILSRTPIEDTDIFTVSSKDNYSDWRTRKVLGIRTKGEWYYSVHFGWWDDKDDPFSNQWERFENHILNYKNEKIWIMGDFNNPAELRNEGFDLIKKSGWYDSFELAETRIGEITVNKIIDGWKDKFDIENIKNGMRIDYIFTNNLTKIKSYKVIFDGKNIPIVSDHFGIIIETEENLSI